MLSAHPEEGHGSSLPALRRRRSSQNYGRRCVRHITSGTVKREVRMFKKTTTDLMALSAWLASEGCTHVVMEATGVYCKPVWHILSLAHEGERLHAEAHTV